MPETLRSTAEAWLAQDPDPETRDELTALVTAADGGDETAAADLADRFDGRLQFGTAGLRGELGAGSTRMNRVLVGQAAGGFAKFLLSRSSGAGTSGAEGSVSSGSQERTRRAPSIVIGYDGRTNSDVFARDTAEIMAGAGIRAVLLPRALPTPVLAFAVRHLDVSAGVMVTASHNPPRDNGYKVYLGDDDHGSQIVSPVDGQIAAFIDEVAGGSVLDLARSDEYETAGDDLVSEYVRVTAAISGTSDPLAEPALVDTAPTATSPAPLRVVYTAMHGVGWEVARRVFATAGFPEPIPVAEQVVPDAAFPTVAFPNPEEPGAMDLSFATASRVEADLILANDPDADRLAVAIPGADGESTSWRQLTGNEVGALLGWRAAERATATGATADGAAASSDAAAGAGATASSASADSTPGALAASIVSSPALRAVADSFGLPFVDTLTGFKWVSRVPGLVYGYEEALGYLVDPAKVRDKDGISAAVGMLALATELATSGSSLRQHLADFDARFGAFASSQVSLRVTDLAQIPRITSALRATPPTAIGGHPVDRLDDFADGFESFPPGDILRFWLSGDESHDGSRVIVRPSGTEPKLKVYIDAWSTTGDAAARRAAADAVVAELDAGVRALLH
ncbi:phospho-sugar mutase [Frondihabitans sp. PhB188]|uniref:phospho-sugar mutase n=1 Tax=Frondihabitans sp. PhB188 TaxID=2485200 RepID=UPI000F4639CA|nr:phospho-sugar mutase [Frondihabitans sp. PhB188]